MIGVIVTGAVGLVVALLLTAYIVGLVSRLGNVLAERDEARIAVRVAREFGTTAEHRERVLAMQQEIAQHKRRADEFFGIIEGLEGEAEQWRDLYRNFLGQASVAQSWLLRELERSTKVANARGAKLAELGHDVKDIEVPAELRAELAKIQADPGSGPMPPGFERAQEIQAEHDKNSGDAPT